MVAHARAVRRFDVYLVNLEPTLGSEIKKTRPCVVVSPDELNKFVRTVIIAPLTTKSRSYPSRVECTFGGKLGQIVLDQIRTIDKSRLIKRLGRIDRSTSNSLIRTLVALFS